MVPENASRERSLLKNYDRRRYARVDIHLLGRFMLENRQEYPCQTIDMSPGDAVLIAPVTPRVGERIVAYLDHVGRIEGVSSRVIDGGFAMTINATLRKRDKLAATLAWLQKRAAGDAADDRRHERIEPRKPFSQVALADGRHFRCRVLDLSLSGAAIAFEIQPPLGDQIMLGGLRATVVRHFEEGVGVEFATVQTQETLQQYI